MKQLLKRWLAAKPARFEVSSEEARWLLGSLVSIFRLALQKSSAEQALASTDVWAGLQGLLDSCELVVEPVGGAGLSGATLTAGPCITRDDTGLVLVLRQEGQGMLVVRPGQSQPEMLSDFRAAGPVYQVRRKISDDSSPEAFGWRWFSREFFSNKPVLRDVLLGSFFLQLLALVFPLATQAIVDKVIANQATSTLIVLGVGLGMMAVFTAALTWLRQYFLLLLSNSLDARLSQRVLAHLFRLPLQYFEKRATGNIVNRVHVIEPIREFVAGAFLLGAIDLPFMLIFLVFMLTYSVSLSAVVGAFVVVMMAISFLVGPKLREHAMRNFQLGAKVQGYLTEQIAASETVKSLQLEHSVERRFAELNNEHLGSSLKLRELGNRYSTVMSLLEQLMNGTVLCLGAYAAMKGDAFTIGMLVAFQQFAQRVVQPLLKLSGLWQQFQQIRVSVAQLGDIMNTPTERYSPLKSSLSPAQGHLVVEGLAFRYSDDSPMLYENLSFEVKPGEIVLITGPSGCGKSTLTKIIQGMYRQTKGVVRLDGRDIRSMSVNELRSQMGVVPQESVLFSGTLLENLLEAAPSVPFEQVVKACQMAGIHDVIQAMPEGYQTKVGERGVGLSGGQRQRMAIARALLKKPKLLIFDESTSGLDEKSANGIIKSITQLSDKGISVLIIAHLSSQALIAHKQITLSKQ